MTSNLPEAPGRPMSRIVPGAYCRWHRWRDRKRLRRDTRGFVVCPVCDAPDLESVRAAELVLPVGA